MVIPARDEAERVGECLLSVQRSLATLPAAVERLVWVVLDRCTDGTAEVVARALGDGRASGWTVLEGDRPLGRVRHAGVQAALGALRHHPVAGVWILGTDADTVVPPGWAASHLAHAAAGAAAVCGVAELATTSHMHPRAVARYRTVVAAQRRPGSHQHVYGANLGVRGDAYQAVGGFGPLSTGEDGDLVRRLVRAGYPVVHPVDVRVRTSARLVGRARGGLADLLAGLGEADAEPA